MLRVVEQAFRTDTGRQRTANEDSFFASAPMFAVADGMGGAQAGEVASRIAAEAFEAAERRDQSPEGYLRAIVETANRSIHGLSQHDSTRTGMGTTLTAALVDGEDVAFAHVGDSRAYVFRDGELRQLTSDHSLVEELRRQGRLTSEQAEDHPQRSIITRALGPEADVEIDTLSFSARPGDIFLLCSDGLTTMVKEEAIAEILRNSSSLSDAVSNLVQGANEAGGRDNITVVAFRLEESDEAAIDPSPTLIGPSAEEAGLTSERVRGAADRAGSRRHEPRRSRVRTAAKVLAVLVVLAGIAVGAYLGMRQVYFLGIDEGGRVSALPRASLRPAVRRRALLRGLLGAVSGRLAARRPPRRGNRSRAPRPRRRRFAARGPRVRCGAGDAERSARTCAAQPGQRRVRQRPDRRRRQRPDRRRRRRQG